nr:SDR family NAD(P)-dependent oxidoreductase [Alteraurantiacibacter buctensis]
MRPASCATLIAARFSAAASKATAGGGVLRSRVCQRAYAAAKFAVDGLTRSLASETAVFGIRFLVIEPSGFATDWAGKSMETEQLAPGYEATVGAFAQMLRSMESAGDPNRAAAIIVDVVKRKNLPSHLLLGDHAVQGAIAYSDSQIVEARTWQAVSSSADFGQPYPVEMPADKVAE